MYNNKFAKRIKDLRTTNNLTMQQLADKIGVTKSSINMWENSGIVPRNEILKKLSQEFKITIDELLDNQVENYDVQEKVELQYIHRGLDVMNEQQLKKTKEILEAVFDDIFNDEEDHNGL